MGTGINAHPDFARLFSKELSDGLKIDLTSADNFFPLIGTQDTAVALSGQLKTTAVSQLPFLAELAQLALPVVTINNASSSFPNSINNFSK